MEYEGFVKLAQEQDERNIFEKYDGNLEFLPIELKSFYKSYNPKEVEIVLSDLTSIRFCPAEYLENLQKQYSLRAPYFIFATCEADPIYYRSDGIYISAHGSENSKENKISDNFYSFIKMLSNEIIEQKTTS